MERTPPYVFFFFNDTATTEIYTLSLHDALPISVHGRLLRGNAAGQVRDHSLIPVVPSRPHFGADRKSTRLNSSHDQISYAVFCLKKKTTAHSALTPPSHLLSTLPHLQSTLRIRP